MKLEGREIALFCKFWFVGKPVRFANECNVGWLLNCPEGQKRKGKNYFFLAPTFNQKGNIIIPIFQFYNQFISVLLGLSLAYNG